MKECSIKDADFMTDDSKNPQESSRILKNPQESSRIPAEGAAGEASHQTQHQTKRRRIEGRNETQDGKEVKKEGKERREGKKGRKGEETERK